MRKIGVVLRTRDKLRLLEWDPHHSSTGQEATFLINLRFYKKNGYSVIFNIPAWI